MELYSALRVSKSSINAIHRRRRRRCCYYCCCCYCCYCCCHRCIKFRLLRVAAFLQSSELSFIRQSRPVTCLLMSTSPVYLHKSSARLRLYYSVFMSHNQRVTCLFDFCADIYPSAVLKAWWRTWRAYRNRSSISGNSFFIRVSKHKETQLHHGVGSRM